VKAMILAAGRGERLRPLTDSIPKTMVPIGDKPLLEHVVRLLSSHGFEELVINLHHLPEVIRDHFGDGSRWGVDIRYSCEEDLLGTAGAVRRMSFFFDEPFLVYYGDNLCNADLGELWRDHSSRRPDVTMGLLWMDEPTNRGIVRLDKDWRVTRIVEKPKPEQVFDDYLVNGGIYVVDPSVVELIPASGPYDFSRHLFPELIASGRCLHGHRLKGQLLSTDTPARYEDTCRQVAAGTFNLP